MYFYQRHSSADLRRKSFLVYLALVAVVGTVILGRRQDIIGQAVFILWHRQPVGQGGIKHGNVVSLQADPGAQPPHLSGQTVSLFFTLCTPGVGGYLFPQQQVPVPLSSGTQVDPRGHLRSVMLHLSSDRLLVKQRHIRQTVLVFSLVFINQKLYFPLPKCCIRQGKAVFHNSGNAKINNHASLSLCRKCYLFICSCSELSIPGSALFALFLSVELQQLRFLHKWLPTRKNLGTVF